MVKNIKSNTHNDVRKNVVDQICNAFMNGAVFVYSDWSCKYKCTINENGQFNSDGITFNQKEMEMSIDTLVKKGWHVYRHFYKTSFKNPESDITYDSIAYKVTNEPFQVNRWSEIKTFNDTL